MQHYNIINQQYNIDLPDDEPFYFNIKEDSDLKSMKDFKPIGKDSNKLKVLGSTEKWGDHMLLLSNIPKKGICTHSLAYSNSQNLCWFGPNYSRKSTKFFTKTKRGRKAGVEPKAKKALKK